MIPNLATEPVQQHESCRPRRPAPSPRVPRSRDGSSVRPRRDPRRTDGRCPTPALTRGRVARGGGTKRGGGPLIASGGPPSRGGGLPRACAGHWCHPWRCGRLCGACSRVLAAAAGWCAVCRLRAWRWAGGGSVLPRDPRVGGSWAAPWAGGVRPPPPPAALTRCRVVRGGGVMQCAGRRARPCGAADGLAPPAPVARDTRRVGPRRRAVPAR